MHCGDTKFSCCYRIVKKQRNSKTNVLSDMLSDSIKYKDFQSTYFLCIIYMYEFRIENPYIQFRQIANQPVH